MSNLEKVVVYGLAWASWVAVVISILVQFSQPL